MCVCVCVCVSHQCLYTRVCMCFECTIVAASPPIVSVCLCVCRTQREAFQYHWRKLHQMSTDLRQVETVDGSQQEVVEEEETSDHSHSGNDLTEGVHPDAGGRGPQGQPSLTEIEAAFER